MDIEAGARAVELMKEAVRSTHRPEVLGGIGGFAGLFEFDKEKYRDPVLVSGADGVGTKVIIAQIADRHDTVGIDLVAMCVNDIVVQGAEPLFFLDYVATGELAPEKVASIVGGVAEGCRQAGCALIGGETAEMPGMYQAGEYDMAGFAVGVVERDGIIDGCGVAPGDVVLGLPSSGLHSNGYSLVRHLLVDELHFTLDDKPESLGCTIGEELLKPTVIYARPFLALAKEVLVKAAAHITGGGLVHNIPRILPKGVDVVLDTDCWSVPPIFSLLQELGEVEEKEMRSTFNMGLGLVIIVSEADAGRAVEVLASAGQAAQVVGRVVHGLGDVRFE